MTFEQIQQALKKKDFKPVYFLHGTEAFFIDQLTDFIENSVLSEAERAFNLSVFYGKEVDHKAVIDAARRYPMGAERQVVILKEAQEMRSLSQLESYVVQPLPTTLLLICHKHKRFDMRSKLAKALKKHAVVFEAKPLYENQIPGWIESWLRQRGMPVEPAAASLIAEYLGSDLGKVDNELRKLALNLPKGTRITQAHIETHIGISKDYNVFELQRALAGREIGKANRIVQYFAANARKHPMPMVTATLGNYFSKVYLLHSLKRKPEKEQISTLGLRSGYFLKEYKLAARNYPLPKVEAAIALLREYDLKSKGVGYIHTGKADGELLREMVYRLLHL